MSSLLTPNFILRTLAGVVLALVVSIAWSLRHEADAFIVIFAVTGWAFSLANGLLAAILMHYSRQPGISIAISAATLVFYPLLQYHSADIGSDREIALEISQSIIGGYLLSGVIILSSMYRAAGIENAGREKPTVLNDVF